MARIFLSYSHNDKDFVDYIEPRIHNIFGLSSLWYDRSKDGLKGGEEWWQKILSEIELAQVFIILVSKDSLNSTYCMKELTHAFTNRSRIIPVLLKSYSEPYPMGFSPELKASMREIHYVNLQTSYDDLSPLWGAILAELGSLTRMERWQLFNQYLILRSIAELKKDKSEISEIDKDLEVLSYGYEAHYDRLSHYIYPPMKNADGELVWEILEMFSSLTKACQRIDCSEINHRHLKFWGFDSSSETPYWSYANLILNKEKRYQEITPLTENVDSHIPMLPIYKAMLEEWRKCNKFDLSKEDVIRITSARKQIRV